ncbi:hypothetical protein T4B_14581 [Trichinella pseudospiralis]|uniref:GAG-pre-integrase domain-containing protein n=1 Tax=Trichinella pseudospiralis TaxID=6337 RepID=A0A0V1J747_TRIPS|nr:hypothetical protein T4B_14581 [Trichinella pseudospiralis]
MAAYIDGITGIMDQLEAIRKTLNNEKKITVEFIKGLLLKNNVQQLALPLPKDEGCAFRVHWDMGVQDVPDLWHRRLRHLSHGSMKLLQDGQATGILSDAITETDCVTCLGGKQCRLATIKSEEALELAQVSEQSNPISYKEAVNHPDANEWLKEINKELASYHESQSWEHAVLPLHKKAIKTMLHKEPYPSLQSEMENASLHCYAMIMEPLASAPISRRQQGQDPST